MSGEHSTANEAPSVAIGKTDVVAQGTAGQRQL